jgi:hypothetical protein
MKRLLLQKPIEFGEFKSESVSDDFAQSLNHHINVTWWYSLSHIISEVIKQDTAISFALLDEYNRVLTLLLKGAGGKFLSFFFFMFMMPRYDI